MRRDSRYRLTRGSGVSQRNGARFVALALLFGAGVAFGAEPKEWLERMNKALTTRNYVGVFTHVHGGRVETLRIIHRVRGHDVSERLLSLDGSGREFIREGTEVTCISPIGVPFWSSVVLPTGRCSARCRPSTMPARRFTKSVAANVNACWAA